MTSKRSIPVTVHWTKVQLCLVCVS